MIKRLISATSILTIVVGIGFSGAYINSQAQTPSSNSLKESTTDSLTTDSIAMCDTICAADSLVAVNDSLRYTTLSDADYRRVAEELGVEVAAIKAVVLIEAGAALEGFLAPGVPVINFDAVMYRKMKSKDTRKAPSDAKIPEGIKSAYGRKEWQQLINARKTNIDKANMGTFWGMFQIGGFNYKICGCKSVDEFVEKMSESEVAQLELFAKLIVNAKQVEYLRRKDWSGFARRYNGPSYAKRGYHTKMANAYRKFKAQEKQQEQQQENEQP